jgi:hypothetical protein
MAIKGNTGITYRDLYKRLKGDGTWDSDIVELLIQENPILDDMVIVEANDGSSDKTSIRTGIPSATWVAYYEGVQASKGSSKQVRDTSGMIETKVEMDERLYNDSPNAKEAWMDEVSVHAEAMNNGQADAMFYGRIATEPRKFNGLINFYNAYAPATSVDDKLSSHFVFNAKSASQASTALLRSIWLIGWSPKSIRCFYPKGSRGGMTRTEKIKVEMTDAAGGTFPGLRQYLRWHLGLTVRDFRYGGRLANIQLDEMLDTSSVPDYVELIRKMNARVKDIGVNQAYYMDRTTWENVETLMHRKTMGNAVSVKELQERTTMTLFGRPVRICDALASNETEVAQAT